MSVVKQKIQKVPKFILALREKCSITLLGDRDDHPQGESACYCTRSYVIGIAASSLPCTGK